MVDEHEIGTRVRVNCPGSRAHGQECNVRSGRYKWGGVDGQEVSIPKDPNHPNGRGLRFEPHELEAV